MISFLKMPIPIKEPKLRENYCSDSVEVIIVGGNGSPHNIGHLIREEDSPLGLLDPSDDELGLFLVSDDDPKTYQLLKEGDNIKLPVNSKNNPDATRTYQVSR